MTTEERFEKMEAAIRDLIVVSRTVLNAVEEMREGQKRVETNVNRVETNLNRVETNLNAVTENLNTFSDNFNALIHAQRETELKVSRLVETVDKLIRYKGPNGQPGGVS